eukprot:scaffold293860_cov35-Prasinocladus_malaysianus.AAC.1
MPLRGNNSRVSQRTYVEIVEQYNQTEMQWTWHLNRQEEPALACARHSPSLSLESTGLGSWRARFPWPETSNIISARSLEK